MENSQPNHNSSPFVRIFLVALTCILAGGLVGATTNMINAAVSPYYFQVTMHWDFADIWKASVAQGIFEGLVYGVVFAIIFTTGFGVITSGRASFNFAFVQLQKTTLVILACWFIGGILTVVLALLSPDFFHAHFPAAPEEFIDMAKFAWVGGSIWGVIAGGFISAILGVVITKNAWKEMTQ